MHEPTEQNNVEAEGRAGRAGIDLKIAGFSFPISVSISCFPSDSHRENALS